MFHDTCTICGKDFSIEADSAEYRAYQEGKPLIKAFAHHSEAERESFRSHMCPECYNRIFSTKDVGIS